MKQNKETNKNRKGNKLTIKKEKERKKKKR
jgi:hypothetical protein